jgi:AcrR family transcriptional regulator
MVAPAASPDRFELPRRERRKLEMRGRILEAAAALFEEKGFKATKVSEICDRADIAQKTFFNHFPAKRDVLREIAHYSVDQLRKDVEAVSKAELSTRDRLLAFFGHMAQGIIDAGPMNREMVTELVHVLSEGEGRSERATMLLDAFGAIVQGGLEAGEITRRHAPETLTEMILGAYYVLMFNYANLEAFPIAPHAEASARFLADALAPQPNE